MRLGVSRGCQSFVVDAYQIYLWNIDVGHIPCVFLPRHLLSRTHGCEMVEIVIPELQEMHTTHLVSIGSEFIHSMITDIEDGKGVRLNYDSRTSVRLFRSFSASVYISAQCLRRRLMYHHVEIFKKVDVIVTPTTGYNDLTSELIASKLILGSMTFLLSRDEKIQGFRS